MGDVVTHKFGKEDREHARTLACLLNLAAEREADMLANPGKYFEIAGKHVAAANDLIERLYAAIQPPISLDLNSVPTLDHIQAVHIDRARYERILLVERAIREAWNNRDV